MSYWPWWAGGLALASVMLLHWLSVRQMMGVSGRFTSLVDHRDGAADHVVFLVALLLGGFVSAALAGRFRLAAGITSDGFARLTRGSPALGAVVLLAGGLLVGFGTRMAGGCTSGHGMCGVSRFQRGSLLATASFFGAAVVVSLLLGRVP